MCMQNSDAEPVAFASLPLVPFKACTLAGTIIRMRSIGMTYGRICVAVSTRDQTGAITLMLCVAVNGSCDQSDQC